MRDLNELVGQIVRVIIDPSAKTILFGKLEKYDDYYLVIDELGNDDNGNRLAIQGLDPGVDNKTWVPINTAILSKVDKQYILPLDEDKLKQALGERFNK